MKARLIVFTVAVLMFGAVVCVAADESVGTWKLNAAKSKVDPNGPKNDTVTIEAAGDNIKVTVHGSDSSGKPTHNEWTGKYDGKDYAVKGDATVDMRAYGKLTGHSQTVAQKKGGKVTTSGRVTYSADGKTRTVTVSGTNPDGKKISSTMVYDKQ